MLYPSIDKLLDKVDSKYSLVVAAAKRARSLRDGTNTHLQDIKSHKQVGVALEELYGDLVKYEKIETKEDAE
ncbi:DNA-directed RNA polymerase subunit omega [Paenibacillus chitinolyticus]|uniref:DNA-directed RNA polymerase subunit omega n=1 Tax=Paenibacillus chitinolyticus TaxID=79263 RepID=A0A410X568_9BACL|nr:MULTISPECIES: DNA-directed RNA polymerase subunit omega [Paenibacillus]MCY9588467.1 DNA-directed RNA polymerase subunit omega [Paenibacillus chitinolyticus]MCY9597837.1 DNA-directed RNA polymerase subunit omega [Paenibacillus chitinolyticus]MEC0247290.1 DNA-directed RNA polymerase subunit omega [Paenibacillus chitinolyticus]QAV21772.1 DNA-directed RNA polymerase subunit omega [Paenibacillus chitinolyticus]GKS10123.1 DNA-directed RNA polymerase subunit omega [Paenibacillus chitinolyticus]